MVLLRITLTLLFRTTEHTRDVASSPGSSVIDPTSRRLGRVAYCTDIRARIIFASPLRTVDAFLRDGITNPLERTTLPELVADGVVQVALKLIDGFDPRHFGLVERVCLLVSQMIGFEKDAFCINPRTARQDLPLVAYEALLSLVNHRRYMSSIHGIQFSYWCW